MLRFITFCLLTVFLATASLANDCEEAKRLLQQHQGDPVSKAKVSWFEKAAELCPDAFHTHFMLGLVLEELADNSAKPDYQKADLAYVAASKLDRSAPEPFLRRAGIAYLKGNFRGAIYRYDRYLKLLPEDFDDAEHVAEIKNEMTKCGWLLILPGTIRMGALRTDNSDLRSTVKFVGGMTREIAASSLSINPTAAGGVVGIIGVGLTLIGKEAKINYAGIDKAYASKKWSRLYKMGKTNLLRIINQKGLETDDTYHLLSMMLEAGAYSSQPLRELKAIARVFVDWDGGFHPNVEFLPEVSTVLLADQVLNQQ